MAERSRAIKLVFPMCDDQRGAAPGHQKNATLVRSAGRGHTAVVHQRERAAPGHADIAIQHTRAGRGHWASGTLFAVAAPGTIRSLLCRT